MSKPHLQETLCQKCGVAGWAEQLIYCSKCQICAEHSYCLNIFPKDDDDYYKWLCEGCFPSLPKNTSVHELPSRRSTRIRVKSGRAAKTLQTLKRQESLRFSVGKTEADEQTSNIASTSESSKQYLKDLVTVGELNESNRCINRDQSGDLKKKRKLILGNSDSSDEEAKCVKGQQLHNASGVPVDYSNRSTMTYHNYVQAQPIMNPAWRGSFDIHNEKIDTVVGHLSSKACLKVFEGAKSLPPLLGMEVLPRLEAWPKSFEASPPTDESIALYFFPGHERVERAFHGLVRDIIDRDLVLKASLDNVELLIFTSHRFPDQYSRFNGQYYLWGIFRARKVSHPQKSADHLLIRNSSSKRIMPISAADNEREGSAKTLQIRSPLSPLSTGSSYGSASPQYLLPSSNRTCCLGVYIFIFAILF